MIDDAVPAPDNPGCLAQFLSVALAALLLTLTALPPAQTVPALYLPVFVVTALVTALIGLPLYLVARHFRQENIWAALVVGATTGAALPLVGMVSDERPEQWFSTIAGYAAVGAIGGLAFFLTATAQRAPLRNAALLLALAGISVAAAPPIVSRISPPAPSSATY
jgi:hypothetical protein